MGHGWTGGQISALRAFVGAAAFARLLVALFTLLAFGAPDDPWTLPGTIAARPEAMPTTLAVVLAGIGLGLAAAVALGIARTLCACLLALVWLVLHGAGVVGATTSWPTVEAVFVLLALLPPAPFGSFGARGRVDPDSGWRLPDGWVRAAWTLLVGTYATVCLMDVFAKGGHEPTAATAMMLVLVSGVFADRIRPLAWLALLLFDLGWWIATGLDPSHGAIWLHAVTFLPIWLPGPTDATTRVFYDGGCGLCHRTVRFLLAEDATGERFRFAALDGSTFEASVPEAGRQRLPDSLVVLTPGGRTLVRSRAVAYTLGRIGGLWAVLSACVRIAPRPVADALYDSIARLRHRLFPRPAEVCPILPPHLRARFDP